MGGFCVLKKTLNPDQKSFFIGFFYFTFEVSECFHLIQTQNAETNLSD